MSSFETFDFLYRVILIGDSGVGKSNLISRYTKNEFDMSSQSTIGVDFSNRNVKIDTKIIKAQIWDTAGQDRFKSISQAFYRGSAAALLVFDLTSQRSFDSLEKWIGEVKKYADANIVLMLVGNKCDLSRTRAITRKSALEYANRYGMDYIETSALDTTNVEEAFLKILRDVYEYNRNIYKKEDSVDYVSFDNLKTENKPITIKPEENEDKQVTGCC